MLKIRVGIPSSRKVCVQTKETFDALKNYSDSEFEFELVCIRGTHCHRARNISSMAVPADGAGKIKQILPYDYYLATDDDMAYVPQSILRLITLDKDIVGAAYPTRDNRGDMIVAAKLGAQGREDWFHTWDTGVQEALWVGGGCMLIKKRVFEAMEYPWWRNEIITKDDVADICTEDVGFCINAAKAGFKIFIDLDNRVAHMRS